MLGNQLHQCESLRHRGQSSQYSPALVPDPKNKGAEVDHRVEHQRILFRLPRSIRGSSRARDLLRRVSGRHRLQLCSALALNGLLIDAQDVQATFQPHESDSDTTFPEATSRHFATLDLDSVHTVSPFYRSETHRAY